MTRPFRHMVSQRVFFHSTVVQIFCRILVQVLYELLSYLCSIRESRDVWSTPSPTTSTNTTMNTEYCITARDNGFVKLVICIHSLYLYILLHGKLYGSCSLKLTELTE